MKVLWFSYMKEVVCDRDDSLVLDPLFDCKPMKGLEYWEDVNMSGVQITARASPF